MSVSGLVSSGGGKGEGAWAPGGTVQGRHLEGLKYVILKFGCFWQIGVCIADSDILHPEHALNTSQFWDDIP